MRAGANETSVEQRIVLFLQMCKIPQAGIETIMREAKHGSPLQNKHWNENVETQEGLDWFTLSWLALCPIALAYLDAHQPDSPYRQVFSDPSGNASRMDRDQFQRLFGQPEGCVLGSKLGTVAEPWKITAP